MAYTTPRTWTPGEYPTAAQFNANIRDNVSFLANPPACRVFHNANQSIAEGLTTTEVLFNSELYDTDTMHSTVSSTGRITLTTAGIYVITFGGFLEAASTYTKAMTFIEYVGVGTIGNGDTMGSLGLSETPSLNAVTTYKFPAAATLRILLRQHNSGGAAKNLLAGAHLEATWIGLG